MTDDKRPRISFAIPYYRNLELLALTLESVIQQDIHDWEAVVVDDAGPEPAAELVASLADPRITYRRNSTNLGLAGNWNRAIAATTAPLVTVLHADDQLLPHYARTMIQLMERNERALAGHCQVELIDVDGNKTRTIADSMKHLIRPRAKGDLLTIGDRGLQSLLRGFWIFCPTLCYRREMLGTVDSFEARWGFVLDFSFVGQALIKGHEFVGSPIVAYRYRRHRSNQTAILTAELVRFDEEFRLYAELAELANEAGWTRSVGTARRALILRAHLVVSATSSLVRGDLRRSRDAFGRSIRKVDSAR